MQRFGLTSRSAFAGAILALFVSACADGVPVAPSEIELGSNTPRLATALNGAGAANSAGPRFIFEIEPGQNPAETARAHGVEPVFVYEHVFNGFAAEVSEVARAGLMKDVRVRRVHDDVAVQAAGEQVNPTWNLDRIDQRSAALDGIFRFDRQGSGTTAYVVDTGIRGTHRDLGGRARMGFDAFGEEDPSDCHGHGTAVAGTIASTTYGVAKKAELVSVRVIDCNGWGSASSVAAGLDWIIGNHDGRPAVANLSLGGVSASTAMDEAVQRVIDAGIAVIAAAGNSSGDACEYSPGRVRGALTVGASDRTDTRLAYSNHGDCVDLFAPGEGVLSTAYESDDATGLRSGTSMAAPHAAGVALLLLEANPTLSPAALNLEITSMATGGVVNDSRSANANLLYSSVDAEPGPVLDPLVPPADLTSTGVGAVGQLTLSWRVQEPRALRAEVQSRPRGGVWSSLFQAATQTSSTFSGLDPNGAYEFRVRVGEESEAVWTYSAWSETLETGCATTLHKNGKCGAGPGRGKGKGRRNR